MVETFAERKNKPVERALDLSLVPVKKERAEETQLLSAGDVFEGMKRNMWGGEITEKTAPAAQAQRAGLSKKLEPPEVASLKAARQFGSGMNGLLS